MLAVLAAALLILSFPDFEYWFHAWFALVPLMWAVERETSLQKPPRSKSTSSVVARSFVLGWIFGTIFFFGTCWWLTYAPIHYAGFPPVLAYFLLFCVTAAAGLFPGIFAAILSLLLRRFGSTAFLAAPFVWVACEFARYWITGNNWNAIAYSQAFIELWLVPGVWTAAIGGVLFPTGIIVFANVIIVRTLLRLIANEDWRWKVKRCLVEWTVVFILYLTASAWWFVYAPQIGMSKRIHEVIAVQPNVPMSGLDSQKWKQLRQRHIDLAETAVKNRLTTDDTLPMTVILPESPMNFMYSDDREFQQFISDFARRNNVNVLFNSAEPDRTTGKYFNSAVMVGPDGRQIAAYDKIYLLPFGEAVPWFLEGLVPGFVGNFAYGGEYDLLPVGDAKAGVMICFESHFGALSREYVRNGADVIIEMTNDGYLGPTPVLRQHLANAVFRAVETSRPVLRATNVGITQRINPHGDICDSLIKCGPDPYTEGVSVWSVSKSDGSQTFYVRYGDWFAWLCSLVTLMLLIASFRPKLSTTN